MRRLTVAFLALGCLSLGIGTWVVPTAVPPISATVSAQATLHTCRQACGQSADHYAFCHVDRGARGTSSVPTRAPLQNTWPTIHTKAETGVSARRFRLMTAWH